MAIQNRYLALLRGINVGGHKKIKMAELRALLSDLGMTDVKTVLASGNAVFSSAEVDLMALTQLIETGIHERFSFEVPTLARPFEELPALVEAEPFQSVTVTPETKLYVTFLSSPPAAPLTVPHPLLPDVCNIVYATDSLVCSALTTADSVGTLGVMAALEKLFGKNITTRTWNTVLKIAAL